VVGLTLGRSTAPGKIGGAPARGTGEALGEEAAASRELSVESRPPTRAAPVPLLPETAPGEAAPALLLPETAPEDAAEEELGPVGLPPPTGAGPRRLCQNCRTAEELPPLTLTQQRSKAERKRSFMV